MWTKQSYYSYTEQLFFGKSHSTKVLCTFFQNYYYLIIKLLFRKQKRTIGSYTNKKVLLSRDSPWFFPAFLFFDEIFFLQINRTAWHGFPFRNCSTVVFAFRRGYVKGVEWLCIQFVKYNTGVILSQSTSTRQPLCARCVLPVGWSCWLHSTRWMYHRTVPMVDTSCNQQAFVFEGLGFFELVFDDNPDIY